MKLKMVCLSVMTHSLPQPSSSAKHHSLGFLLPYTYDEPPYDTLYRKITHVHTCIHMHCKHIACVIHTYRYVHTPFPSPPPSPQIKEKGGDAIRRRHPSQSIPLHFMPCLTRPHMNRPQTSHQRAVKLSVLK